MRQYLKLTLLLASFSLAAFAEIVEIENKDFNAVSLSIGSKDAPQYLVFANLLSNYGVKTPSFKAVYKLNIAPFPRSSQRCEIIYVKNLTKLEDQNLSIQLSPEDKWQIEGEPYLNITDRKAKTRFSLINRDREKMNMICYSTNVSTFNAATVATYYTLFMGSVKLTKNGSEFKPYKKVDINTR